MLQRGKEGRGSSPGGEGGKWSDLVCCIRCLEDRVRVGRCRQSPIKKFRMSWQTTEGFSENEQHE